MDRLINRKKAKNRKKSRPTPVSSIEQNPASLAPPVNDNGEEPRPAIDKVLQAESTAKMVGQLLQLQQQKIESLVRVNNANHSLGGEMVKLMRENVDLKERVEEQKRMLVGWKHENIRLRNIMLWAEAEGCTHLDKRFMALINGTRRQFIAEVNTTIQKRLDEIDRIEDPEKRRKTRERFRANNSSRIKTLKRMAEIAQEVGLKQKKDAELQQVGERVVQSEVSEEAIELKDQTRDDPTYEESLT